MSLYDVTSKFFAINPKVFELLKKITGIYKSPIISEKSLAYQCEECGRKALQMGRCMYCGGNKLPIDQCLIQKTH